MLSPGTLLNRYRIVRQLGAGGMGEVYEAEDSRLKRRVAIKLLPEGVASDPERLARLEHEAQAVAALNHPNIVTIHSVEEHGERLFLTMELVEGRPLDQLIPAGGLTARDLLAYAVPLVDAIAAAHARGIVHRDLKPANVMVCADGRVKVLDFGLAKLVATADETAGSATRTALPTVTAAGQVMGTPAYMSPEQAEGRPVDWRTDVFSLGTMLYEMASGVRPFRGDSTIAILSSIVRDDPPPIATVRRDVPRPLDGIVARCLSKDPAKRPPAGVIAEQLTKIAAMPLAPASPWRRFAVIAAVTAALAVAALFAVRGLPERRGKTIAGTPTFTRLTYANAVDLSPSLSPDGRRVVFARQELGGPPHLQVSPMTGPGSSRIFAEGKTPAIDDLPAFSPDGRFIAFFSTREGGDGLFVMSSDGGSARRVVNAAYDPAWTPDGREIVYSTESGQDPDGREAPSEVWAVTVATGARRRVAATDAVDPTVSPDGRFVAYWGLPVDASGTQFAGADRDIWVQPLGGGPRVQITSGGASNWNPAWSADGRFIYFSSDRSGTMNIWRIPIDPRSGAAAGAPVAVTAPSLYVGSMSIGRDGTLVYSSMDYDTAIRGMDFDPQTGAIAGPARDVVTGHRSWLQPDVSPDGRLLTLRSFRAQEDVWVVGTDGSGLRPLTNDSARDRGGRFAPDGSILFYSSRGGSYQFWSVRPDGSGLRQLTHGDWALNYPLPSPDGRLVAATNPNTNEQYLFDTRHWSQPPRRLPSSPIKGQMYLRDWSPDGGRLLAADTSGGLWVFDLAANTWTSAGTGGYPRWLPDGRRALATRHGHIVLVDTRTGAIRDLYGEPGRAIGSVALAPGGRRVYFTSAVVRSNIWMMRLQSQGSRD